MVQKIYRFFGKIGYLHEFFHYLPARLFGADATLSEDRTDFEGDLYDWQYVLILLTPALVGFLGLLATWKTWPNHWPKTLGWVGFAIFWVGWILGCGWDFYEMIRFLRTRKDSEKDEHR